MISDSGWDGTIQLVCHVTSRPVPGKTPQPLPSAGSLLGKVLGTNPSAILRIGDRNVLYASVKITDDGIHLSGIPVMDVTMALSGTGPLPPVELQLRADTSGGAPPLTLRFPLYAVNATRPRDMRNS